MVCPPGTPNSRDAAKASKKQEVVFQGVVESTSNLGRTALVRVERSVKGNAPQRTVEVRGAADDPNLVTSGDRSFETGARYEFYPKNNKEPYLDHTCTVTSKETSPGRYTPGGEELSFPAFDAAAALPAGTSAGASPVAVTGAAGGLGLVCLGLRRLGRRPATLLMVLATLAASLAVVERPVDAGNVEGAPGQQFRHWGRAHHEAQARPGVRNQIGVAPPWPGVIQAAINTWNGGTPRTDFVYLDGGPPSCADGTWQPGITICLQTGPIQCGTSLTPPPARSETCSSAAAPTASTTISTPGPFASTRRTPRTTPCGGRRSVTSWATTWVLLTSKRISRIRPPACCGPSDTRLLASMTSIRRTSTTTTAIRTGPPRRWFSGLRRQARPARA